MYKILPVPLFIKMKQKEKGSHPCMKFSYTSDSKIVSVYYNYE